jgi:hypothetical protein
MKFVDRDEHVYFWFPLLAGLSELTFDPRPEIRRSALEVRAILCLKNIMNWLGVIARKQAGGLCLWGSPA